MAAKILVTRAFEPPSRPDRVNGENAATKCSFLAALSWPFFSWFNKKRFAQNTNLKAFPLKSGRNDCIKSLPKYELSGTYDF